MATAYWVSDIVHVAAKLGLAGLAQVSGYRAEAKNDQDVIESTKLDITYIEDWSLPLDFWIILKTMRQVVSPPRRHIEEDLHWWECYALRATGLMAILATRNLRRGRWILP
jgi:hypothetical protein